MTRPGPKKNQAASVRDRLSKLGRARNEDPNFVLNRYAMERFLYRLSRSAHEPKFVLKGAMLFTVWSGHPHRATKDIDLLGTGAPDLTRLAQIFRDVCSVTVEDDGLSFDAASVTTTRIKEDADYEGVRVQFSGTLGTALLNLQVDIGFGDAVTPAPATVDFPALLEFPPARVRAYPRETVVAEKLEAMVFLGLANSRMKDFFDLAFLARRSSLMANFSRRRSQIHLPTARHLSRPKSPLRLRPRSPTTRKRRRSGPAFSSDLA